VFPFTGVETITIDKWYRPLGEPVRSIPRNNTSLFSSGAFAPPVYFGPEIISVDKWFNPPLREPVRLPSRAAWPLFVSSGQVPPVFPFTGVETITLDKWFRPLGEPVRLVPRNNTALISTGIRSLHQLTSAQKSPQSTSGLSH
jgi:hypothetical protein